MEKLIYKRFFKNHKVLYDYQCARGFRENYSTSLSLQLIEITDNILENLQNRKHVAGLDLDPSKAFDIVDHKILLNKLNHYGIRSNTLQR